MTFVKDPSRRLFLHQATALGTLGAAAPVAMNLSAMGAAAAATASDYKALVCIFLHGGNDSYNTVLATDTASWANYTAIRNQAPESIALLKNVAADRTQKAGSPAWLGGVLPISPLNAQGRTFALHPQLPNLQSLFNTAKRLAVVANVGPMVEPLSKEEYNAGSRLLPLPLFSHNDQQSYWQAMAPEGANRGWGGRMADLVAAGNTQSMFTAISTSGNSVWLYGDQIRQYHLAATGAIKMGIDTGGSGPETLLNSRAAVEAMKRIASTATRQHVMMKDIAVIQQASIQAESIVSQALPRGDISPYGPASLMNYTSVQTGASKDNPLAQQLRVVARMIAAGPGMGLKRQVFFVTLPGFDTHANQNERHSELMAMLNQGMAYFDNVMQQLNMGDRVTTFTASDFGRTFTSNGDGTDHGWGGHQFVMGGAVKGGDIHGAFPTLAAKNAQNNGFDASTDQLYNGALLPRQSVAQMGATLGKWFGLNNSQLADVFPTLGNFGSATDLRFMNT